MPSLPVLSFTLNQDVRSDHIKDDLYLDLCIWVGREGPMSVNRPKSTDKDYLDWDKTFGAAFLAA